MLVEKELVTQIRKTGNADDGGRKDMSLLCDKVLGTIIFSDRKAGNIRS